MSIFDPAFQRTMRFEGVTLENVSGDPGGLTFCGIARNPHPEWSGWAIIDDYLNTSPDFPTAKHLAVNDQSLMGLVEQFYKNSIWNSNNLGQLSTQELSTQVYDAIVNCGQRPVKWLQVLVGSTADGALGPQTVDACNRFQNQDNLIEDFLAMRRNYYKEIVAAKPEMGKFLDGWLNRCVRT